MNVFTDTLNWGKIGKAVRAKALDGLRCSTGRDAGLGGPGCFDGKTAMPDRPPPEAPRPARRLPDPLFRLAVRLLPDPLARRAQYRRRFGRNPPQTFTQKIVHRKYFDRDPRMPPLADKIEAKRLVAPLIGERWITPTLFAGPSLPPLAERNWRPPYAIKASHRSGAVLFVRSGADVDWARIERQCGEWTASLYGQEWHEWCYGQVPPRILVEPLIAEPDHLLDYKFYVFGGRVALVQVDLGRHTGHSRAFYDRDWQRRQATYIYPPHAGAVPKPPHLEEMIRAAETIGAGWSFVRVDLYDLESGPRFGEVTFYPEGGRSEIRPREVDLELGRLWPMPRRWWRRL
jgi:hypothetical protein